MVSYVALDHNDKEACELQKEKIAQAYENSLSMKDGGMFETAFHAIYSTSEELMLWVSDFAKKHNLKLHIHLSETEKEVNDCKELHGGLTPVEYLDSLGILNSDVIAAHTLWLTENDIEILGKRKVNCVHNINSNTKLASGYKFKYNERPRSYSEEKHGDEDIPSAKAVRDTAVEERNGKVVKSRRQSVCGREYIVLAEFAFRGTQSTVDLLKQVIDLEEDAKNISA